MAGEFTEAEAAIYDRQIRLWGLDAQQRYVLMECDDIHMGSACAWRKFWSLDSMELPWSL